MTMHLCSGFLTSIFSHLVHTYICTYVGRDDVIERFDSIETIARVSDKITTRRQCSARVSVLSMEIIIDHQ